MLRITGWSLLPLLGTACAGYGLTGIDAADPGAYTAGDAAPSGADDDDGSTVWTAPGGGSGGGTGDAADPGGPEILSLDLSEFNGGLSVRFTLDDPDGDLEGGAVELTVSGYTQTFLIPQDLQQWDGRDGVALVDTDPCAAGSLVQVEAQVYDAAGNASAPASASTMLSGQAEILAETGDDQASVVDLGTISFPFTLCGDVYRAANDGNNSYTGDLDYVTFRVATRQAVTFSLTWDAAGSDYDLQLYDDRLNRLEAAISYGPTQPETFTHTLQPGTTYLLMVGAWAGDPGDWITVME